MKKRLAKCNWRIFRVTGLFTVVLALFFVGCGGGGGGEGITAPAPPTKVSGSGYNFPVPKYQASLSLNVDASSLETSWLKYEDTSDRLLLESTEITEITGAGKTAIVKGIGEVNRISGCTFTATVTDGDPDAMGIEITGGDSCTTFYSAASQAISVGEYIVE